MWKQLLDELERKDQKTLARSISFVENEQEGYEKLLEALPVNTKTKIIGITGAPGAGKSTLTDSLIGYFLDAGKRVAVLCIDPSSPFNHGAVLGDRIRMSNWYLNADVFIRSLATRGSLGGLHPMIIEITELVKAAGYDIIIIETVGVGQSEVEIAGLADTTVVVLVPESGDEIQTMKAGLMEIADIFVVNKSDRPDSDIFLKNLRLMLAPAFQQHSLEIPIIKTIATSGTGINHLYEAINNHNTIATENSKKSWLLTEKAFQLIQKVKMKNINKEELKEKIMKASHDSSFNLYKFVNKYSS